ncbi:hypothetical protein [Xanthomonas campestris]|uniref:hypothetical protein n=1 Tax=Xanthomonas campestris TaxID=339 RepID=UPI003555CC07
MFTGPGVKAVDDLRLIPSKEHGRAIAATINVTAPSVDLDLVHAVIAQVLADQFHIDRVMLCFNDPDRCRRRPLGHFPIGALLKKM